MKKYGRIDANQKAIVTALRQRGASVVSLAPIGKGVPDVLCAYRGTLYLLEIKDGKKAPSARPLTPDQQKFHMVWKDVTHTVLSVEEALQVIGIKEK